MDRQEASAIPYRQLGRQLRVLRDRSGESLAEASGAVEIDVKQLANIELGRSRPAEDVLLLLISHFGAKDDEAIKLWELAGYDMGRIPASHMASADPEVTLTMIGSDQKVLFTDIVDVIVNNYGVVMNFMQSGNSGKPPASVARVGMSREHAKSVLKILQMTLDQTEASSHSAKRLPTAENQTPDSNSSN